MVTVLDVRVEAKSASMSSLSRIYMRIAEQQVQLAAQPGMEIVDCCIQAVTLAAFSLEANINEKIAYALYQDTTLTPVQRKYYAELEPNFQVKVSEKYKRFARKFMAKKRYDRTIGRLNFTDMKMLFAYRNALAHFRPRFVPQMPHLLDGHIL